jgi:putative hydrolase of the HAD superfamily
VEIDVVAFDADDTLWHSEMHFVETETRFVALLEPWADSARVSATLLQIEKANLDLFGYGMKAFTLSMVEAALDLSGGQIGQAAIGEIVNWGKQMLDHGVELIDDVAEVVAEISRNYRLVLITKGDLAHTWNHEVSESQTSHDRLHTIDNIAQIVPLLSKTAS